MSKRIIVLPTYGGYLVHDNANNESFAFRYDKVAAEHVAQDFERSYAVIAQTQAVLADKLVFDEDVQTASEFVV